MNLPSRPREFSVDTAEEKDAAWCLPGRWRNGLMTNPPCTFPLQFWRPWVSCLSQITSSLYISGGVAANNKLMLSSSQITPVINVSAEVLNALYEDTYHVSLWLLRLHCRPHAQCGDEAGAHAASPTSQTSTPCPCWTPPRGPSHAEPNDGFWEGLSHYEFQLFDKNVGHMVSSTMGGIPGIYEKEVHLVIPLWALSPAPEQGSAVQICHWSYTKIWT